MKLCTLCDGIHTILESDSPKFQSTINTIIGKYAQLVQSVPDGCTLFMTVYWTMLVPEGRYCPKKQRDFTGGWMEWIHGFCCRRLALPAVLPGRNIPTLHVPANSGAPGQVSQPYLVLPSGYSPIGGRITLPDCCNMSCILTTPVKCGPGRFSPVPEGALHFRGPVKVASVVCSYWGDSSPSFSLC